MPPTSRYRAIDVLRGWAIVLMVSTHVGGVSRVSALINLPYWLDPAGPFVLLSGLVLGMTARGGKSVTSIWKRARQLWLVHLGGMVVVLFVHETTGRLNVPSLAQVGGVWAALWKLPTLRLQSLDYMNILPLFVVFFVFAPLLVLAMRRGATLPCLLVSFGLWLFTQHDPGWMRFTDRACGTEAFALPAWQFPFVLGMVFGFHAKTTVSELYPRHRAWLVPAMTVVVGAMFLLAQLQRKVAARVGLTVPESLGWLLAKETWAPGRALYTVSCLGLGYVVVDAVMRRGRPDAFLPLEVLGRKSLYCFLVHLPFALLFSGLNLREAPIIVQDLTAISAVLGVYLLAKHHVLGRYIPS